MTVWEENRAKFASGNWQGFDYFGPCDCRTRVVAYRLRQVVLSRAPARRHFHSAQKLHILFSDYHQHFNKPGAKPAALLDFQKIIEIIAREKILKK